MHISGLAINMIKSFWKLCVFVVFFVVVHVHKKNNKLVRGVSGWCLANPSFSLIFGIFLT